VFVSDFSSSSLDVAFVASAVYHKYNLDVVDIVPFDVVPVDAVASTVAMALASLAMTLAVAAVAVVRHY